MRMTKLLSLLLCVCLGLCGATQDDSKGIFIDPATVDFNLLSGQSATAKVMIINRMDTKKQFRVYLNDWRRDSFGKHTYVAPGTFPQSCARWVSFDKEFVELNPGESMPVTIKMTMPDSADAIKQMKWAMLFIETIEEKKSPTKFDGVTTSIQTAYRVGVHIYQTPPTKVNKELQMISFEPRPNSKDSIYRIVCQNTGDIQLHCKGYIELQSLSTGKRINIPSVDFPMFPAQTRFVEFKIPADLSKGKYTIVGAIDAGEDLPLEAAESTIEIK